ncbi:aminotransferase class I/II-fold pyridoxal phosphate-dependent enzyme [Massilia horti]|uniref:Aminotransferase class I/II-fold pyridoxal phosphate-dependent enzyme n=2 Tax=Massilia horti TaxID=2562153 RepID=A0A4Y9SYR8_9BURK|nr:aminotransferase class I/II-fold pyridoxal phosphate-dependent enzyme [Massilia horti]
MTTVGQTLPLAEAPSAGYPESHVPVTPVLSLASFGRGGERIPSVLDAGAARLVTSGRVAIALALREMGIGPGDAVLVPSYHCASMIEPVVWAGARPVFYRIRPDTSVDLIDVAAKLDADCKVLMATNYYGFPQDLVALRAFCDARGIALLEDCAHCFLGQHKGKPVGSYGDYAIASSMKFFPMYEGGVLVSARHSLAGVHLQPAGKGFEAKAAINTLEDSFAYGRLFVVRALLALPLWLKDVLWGRLKGRKESAPSLAPGSSDGGFGFDPRWLDKRSSLCSRLLLRLVSRPRMGALRRRNYLKLQAALHGLPGCRPLFATLPDGVCPWIFPLLVDRPQPLFRTLKMQGVPILRFGEYPWPGVDASVCPASADLSQRVLSFPCHQELREAELDWMISQIKDALLQRSATAP